MRSSSEMPAPDVRTRGAFDDRRSSSRGPSSLGQRSQNRSNGKEKMKEKVVGPLDSWVEPALDAPKPSYLDSGLGAYGVLEHMQPLGEAPSAKVKGRVKTDGTRKSVLGRSSAAPGAEVRDTPEGSPAPVPASVRSVDPVPAQTVVIDDEKDGDYAPTMNGKKKERSMRARTVKQKSESASSATPAADSSRLQTQQLPAASPGHRFEYDLDKLRRVVDAAKNRAIEVGKPDLANAVNEIFEQSLTDTKLRILLEAILTQQATQEQTEEFSHFVKAARKKLKDAKNKARQAPAANPYTQQNIAPPYSAPTPTPQVMVQPPPPQPSAVPSPAIPSTERPETSHKSKLKLKVKSPAKDPNRKRGNGNMSVSPRKRAGSTGSDSSLTSMTSNEDNNDDMDVDTEPEPPTSKPAGSSSRGQNVRGKDHAAERGSLAVTGTAAKRSSADAELEQERDRDLAAKKQKMSESTARDFEYPESSIRPAMPAPRSRPQRVRDGALAPPSLRLEPNGSRAPSTRGGRAVSTDIDSPLSDLSPAMSRQSTPQIPKVAPKATGKRAKTKQSPEKKHHQAASGGMSGAGGAGRDSPIGDDDNEELSENNDFCEACGGSGYLLCCDGCHRSFHFSCLDPPISDDAKELDEPWFCFVCNGKRPVFNDSPQKTVGGLFAPLLSSLKKSNPATFTLTDEVRNYFEGVSTDKNGNFTEALNATKTIRGRPGYSDEQPDYYKIRDSKGNIVLCYSCGKTSQGKRAIVTCDHCSQHWHLDCLDPPLANPPALNQNGKKVHDWMCPLHADQELRRVDMLTLSRRTIHVRKPKNPKIVETALSRGIRNNGIIEIAEEDSDGSDSEFFDQEEEGVVYKLPEKGIKLDFIDKVKNSRVQKIRDIDASYKRARLHAPKPSALKQANFAKRPFNEKQVALQLAQFANDNQDLNLGNDQVENLVGTLIAEAPAEVVDDMMASEDAEKTKSASSAIPPSPPSSDQPEQLSAEQRKELQLLQELIRRKLENSKT